MTTKPPTAAWNNSAVTWLLGSEIDLYLWAVNVWILLHTVTLAYSWLFLFSCPGCSTDEECPEPKHSAQCECEVTHFKCRICVSYQQHTVLFCFFKKYIKSPSLGLTSSWPMASVVWASDCKQVGHTEFTLMHYIFTTEAIKWWFQKHTSTLNKLTYNNSPHRVSAAEHN